MKKLVSLLLTGTISLGGIPAALSHYTSALNWRRPVASCNIDDCTRTDVHEHEICTDDSCTGTTYHEHDNTLYLPEEPDVSACSNSICTNTEQHTHSVNSTHGRKSGNRHH